LLTVVGVAVTVLLAGLTFGWIVHRLAGPEDGATVTAAATPRSGLPTVPLRDLPVQAHETLTLVDSGGKLPYAQDGTTFNNIEGLLPARPRGYYREYTVPTPGERDRGARRLILGRDGDVYYTEDHYESFRQVVR
jgi:ribonuclease T1